MTLRKLIPLTALPLLTALAAGTGCQRPAAAASQQQPLAQTPAPFATPPVLPGTPDIATLAAKVRPAVVNITTVHEVHMPRGDFGFPGFGDSRRSSTRASGAPGKEGSRERAAETPSRSSRLSARGS